MAPFDVTTWGAAAEPAVHLALGAGFGFALERAGFGSAKKLTSQFYLRDMTVLKVMFTAIITAMVLLLGATTFGLIDYERLWVNPTYLGSGIVGGLIFGVGFVVGGYCPGTALVSVSTLKIDGLLFTVGILGGILAFGYTEPLIDAFWNDAGNLGRLTLFDWLGLSMPVVVLMVVSLALLMFAGAEWVERLLNRQPNATPERVATFRPAYVYATGLVAASTVMSLLWSSTSALRTRTTTARSAAQLAAREVQIDARELADLMRDKRLALAILDLRDESSYNQFHLLDARRVERDLSNALHLPSRTIKVLVADDEAAATEAYQRLMLDHVENLYLLEGGMKAWSSMFAPPGEVPVLAALGSKHPFSRPPPEHAEEPAGYVPRVKRVGVAAKEAGGGCGG